MFCPRCGSGQDEELKFCKVCGANLFAVRQVVNAQETGEKFDWSKTWLADMFMSGEEAQRRELEHRRLRGITPAMRRYQEIKAGVITGSTGLALAIFLRFFMQGIIHSGKVSPSAAPILSHLWVVGIIPLFVGIAVFLNGYFVSKKIVELAEKNQRGDLRRPEAGTQPQALRAADTNEFINSRFSVTEGTTQHLESSNRR